MVTRRADGVFVSSAYQELVPYRKAAIDAVWRCKLVPIGMEREDIAKPMTISESSYAMVEEAVVYVGIFAFRYGKVTVEELRYAQKRKMPMLAFLAEEPVSADDHEPNLALANELDEIKEELRTHYTVATFRSPEELGIKVLRSLLELRQQGIFEPTADNTLPSASAIPALPNQADPAAPSTNSLKEAELAGRYTSLTILVTSIERLSNRKRRTHRAYFTIHAFLFALLIIIVGFDLLHTSRSTLFIMAATPMIVAAIGILGVTLCLLWRVHLDVFRRLITAKFQVISDLEEELPFAAFQHEWNALQRQQQVSLTTLERLAPVLFFLLYVIGMFQYFALMWVK